ncbi:MAG: adenylosuccinate lyase [Thermodesulfobacteriota bacterium]|nr:adenylosuccinate lyase [Thermodesulfobacteriota bacterium]
MIERYTRKEMGQIWEQQNRYDKWLEIEILVCEALCELGEIPVKSFENIKAKARYDIDRILEIEAMVKHDVVAFLTCVSEFVGDDAQYIHLGLTSSDILDTSLALLLKEASDLIIKGIEKLMSAIKNKAFIHKNTIMIGRSHGIHAEPITLGFKLAIWYDEMRRNLERMERARDTISYGKISGAVGTYANISPKVEVHVCEKLGLKPVFIASQIIQRDIYGEYFSTLALIASSLDKFAIEIRHLQRTEVREVEEYFSPGQKGSSAMPHKRNPVLSENISGLARLLRSYAIAALENVSLWHERDISHSSVERVIAPDGTILIDFMLNRMSSLVENLIVYPENMQRNLENTKGIVFSESVMLKLIEKEVSREEAYKAVQKCAMKAWEENLNFKELVFENDYIKGYLSKTELEEIFDVGHHLKNVDEIFRKVFEQ